MEKPQNKILPTLILCVSISTFFFLYMLMPHYIIYWYTLMLVGSFIYIILRGNITIYINPITLLWLFFILYSFFGLITSEGRNSQRGSEYILSLFIGFLILILLLTAERFENILINSIVFVSLFYVGASILQILNPNLLIELHSIFKNQYDFASAVGFINNGIVTGLIYNTGPNAYVISIFLLFCYIHFFSARHIFIKTVLLLLTTLNIYLLLLTGKRGFTIFILLILVYLTYRLSENKIKAVLAVLCAVIVFLALIFNTEAGQMMILRTEMQDDVTSGRLPVYRLMWQDFKYKPLFGYGTLSTNLKIRIYNGHNIYLQVLRENGLIGFISFFLALIIALFKTDRLLLKSNTLSERNILAFSFSIQLLFVLWGVTGNPLYDIYPLILYFVAISISIKNTIDKQKESITNVAYNINYRT